MEENNTIVLIKINTPVLEKNTDWVLNRDMKFSERVKKARKYAKMSQESLALAVGCSQGLISKIERGEQEETAYVVKIARACKVNVDWLDAETGEMAEPDFHYPPNSPESKALSVMQQMDEATKYQAVRLLNSLAEPVDSNGHTNSQ
ncbi:helix-turn-helix domain-containing protein [Methylophilus sp. Leaf414]|uniref:helix-turn-helix domain-containing protein n=1 Tax=Methylophilus sp. Leaf414 TaxID=1736371 RepID=UPI0006FD0168|nr:helix-turn-helix transcriptional regulator [Methylophilus sp. Leaf414]KQT37700.1 hypothetical protein ASG24_01505 [Methylophilus sp. Leaf414]